jgi:hypothetical protein
VDGRSLNLPTFDIGNSGENYISRFIKAAETGGFLNPNWGLYKPGVQIMASGQPNTTNYDSAAAAYVPVGEYPGTKGTVMLTDSGPYKYSPSEAANLLSHELVHVNQPLGTLNEASSHFLKGMSKDITGVIPHLQKQYGYWGGYDNAKNTPDLKERMADLQGFQFNQGIDFAKDPVKGLLFLVLIAVGYLYVDNKMNYTSQIDKCGVNVQELTKKVDLLDERLRKSDSTLARAGAKLEMLNEIKGLK